MLKLDFKNAFNSVRRDKMLVVVQKFAPDLLPFIHSIADIVRMKEINRALRLEMQCNSQAHWEEKGHLVRVKRDCFCRHNSNRV